MARIGLGIACPNCGKELSTEGGLTPGLFRETIRLRVAEAEAEIRCKHCGSDILLGPVTALPKSVHPVERRPLDETLRESAE